MKKMDELNLENERSTIVRERGQDEPLNISKIELLLVGTGLETISECCTIRKSGNSWSRSNEEMRLPRRSRKERTELSHKESLTNVGSYSFFSLWGSQRDQTI